MQSLGGKRPKKRTPQEVFVRRRFAAQDFGERRRRSVELHSHDQPPCHVDTVRAPSVLHELQRACRLAPVKSTEKIAETGGTEPTGKKHGYRDCRAQPTVGGKFSEGERQRLASGTRGS